MDIDEIINRVLHDMRVESIVVDGDRRWQIHFPPWLSKNHTKQEVDHVVKVITKELVHRVGEEL